MVFIHILINSFKLPNKQAIFKLNRTGMDVVVVYLFILLFVTSVPGLIEQLQITEGLTGRLPFIQKFIYFFMFYYLPLTIAVFVLISILAYLGVGLAKLMQRKLRYQIIWKLLAYTTTIPFLLYTIAAVLFPITDRYLFFAIIFSVVLLFLMISKFPRRKKRNKR